MTTIERSPAAFSGSFTVPELGLERRWCMADEMPVEMIPEIVNLLERAYNGGPLWFSLPVDHAAHFRWKYLDFPGGAQMLLTLDAEGRIIRFMGNAFRRWLIAAKIHVASDGMDLALEPAWQGRRLNRAFRPYRGRTRHPDVGFGLSYYTHPVDVHTIQQSGDGWQLGNPVQTLVRPFGFSSLVPNRLRRMTPPPPAPPATGSAAPTTAAGSRTAEAIRATQRTNRDRIANITGAYTRYARSLLQRRPRLRASRLHPVTIERFDHTVEDLVAVASNDFDLIEERSLEFLNWRYADPRAGACIVRAVIHDSTVLGYAVTMVQGDRSWLVDLLVWPGREDVTRALGRDAVRLARRHHVAWMRARLATRHPYARALREAGFAVETTDAGVWIEPYRDDLVDVERLRRPEARVHIVFGDSDHI